MTSPNITTRISRVQLTSRLSSPKIETRFTQRQGLPGPAGKSAYQIYLDNGGTLSEQDWIDSFVDTYSRTEIENLLDANFANYYTKTEIDNRTVDGGNF